MMISRTWKPWVAGGITLLAAMLALTGWWLVTGDDSDAVAEGPLSGQTSTFGGATDDDQEADSENEPTDDTDGGVDLPRDGMTSGTAGGDGTGSGSTSGDRDGDGNPDDISDLAGEGEDYGPADETDPGEMADTGGSDVVFYMPGVDWTDYADLFGGTDDPEIVCPPGFRTPAGGCIDYSDQLERMGRIPVPGGGY